MDLQRIFPQEWLAEQEGVMTYGLLSLSVMGMLNSQELPPTQDAIVANEGLQRFPTKTVSSSWW